MRFHTFEPTCGLFSSKEASKSAHLIFTWITYEQPVTPLRRSPAPWDCWPARSSLCVAVAPAGTGHADASEASPPLPLKGGETVKNTH